MSYEETDKRLEPNARKHPKLWQLYLLQQELVEFRKRHSLRKKSALAGKSNLNADFEQTIIDRFSLDQHVDPKNTAQREGGTERNGTFHLFPSWFSEMVKEGEEVGPMWNWLMDHKGIGESLAAKILALIDDIEKFPTVAKLWRYAGYGLGYYWVDKSGKVICPQEGWKWVKIKKGVKYRIWTVVDSHVTQDGNAIPLDKQYAIPQNNTLPILERVDFLEPDPEWELKLLSDRRCKHYHLPFCTPLKSTLFLIADMFVKNRTVPYRDMYDYEKERLMTQRGIKRGHANNMALRKVKKEFLKQLWLAWRQFEGLDIGEEYK